MTDETLSQAAAGVTEAAATAKHGVLEEIHTLVHDAEGKMLAIAEWPLDKIKEVLLKL